MSCYKCKQKCCTCNTKCTKSCGNTSCNCVTRYNGPDIDCLGISEGDTFETVLSNLSAYVCDINFEDGVGIQNMTYNPVTDDFEVTLTDGTVYNFTGLQGDDGQSIDHTSFTSTTAGAGQPASLPGETDTYTVWGDPGESVNLGTFTVYNGDDANTDYGNTLFVDRVYGNNTTGTRERFDLPYATVPAALSDAVDGDTVIVRAGEYTESVSLKDGVDIYFEQNTILKGQITDDGVSVKSVVSGDLKLEVDNNAIELTGSNSEVTCTLDYIKGSNTPILVRPVEVGSPNATATFNINKVVGMTLNYFATIYGNAYVTINIKDKIETEVTTSSSAGFSGFFLNNDFRGRLVVKCPYFFIGKSEHDDAGVLLKDGSSNTNPSEVFLDIDKFKCTYDNELPSASGIIDKVGASRMSVNIKEFSSITRTPIKVYGELNGGSLVFNGNIYSEGYPCVHYRSNQKTVLKGVLKRGSGGLNEAVVVMAGVNTSYGGISGPDVGWRLQISATIVKDGGASDPGTTGEIVSKRTSDDPIYIVDSHIELIGLGNVLAISGSGATDDDFYILNTFGNVDNSTATVNNVSTLAGSGYTFDSTFKQFEDQ